MKLKDLKKYKPNQVVNVVIVFILINFRKIILVINNLHLQIPHIYMIIKYQINNYLKYKLLLYNNVKLL